ncbi:MAG: long-chain fatty acid transport protein [Bacteroidota bacterium]|nr:long-chain fatty acid transport protein [Bacteroidota bacterium]
MKKIYFLIGFFINTICLHAQNHYWLQQFGAENTLLGGAVVGGVSDNAAMYYNPARLGFITATKISVSANAYGVDLIKLKNAAGNGLELKSSKLLLYPQIASGSIDIKKKRKLKFIYGTLVRYRSQIHFEQENSMNYNVFTKLPGDEFYDARVDFDYNVIANWIGGSLAYRLNDNWSIGYTQFFTYINVQYHQGYTITTDNHISKTDFVSSNNHSLNFNLNSVNVIEKIGIAYEKKSAKKEDFYYRVGLCATMPSLKMYSSSKVTQISELNNIDEHNFSVDSFFTSSTVLNNSNKKIKSNLKDPASIALGFEIENSRIRFCTTVEYFFRVKEYTMIRDNSQTVKRPVQNGKPEYITDYMTIHEAKSGVLNAGFGIEFKFNTQNENQKKEHTWSILIGARTDFNNDQLYRLERVEPGAEQIYNPDNWGYIHYSAGAALNRRSDKFTFGLDYGRGITVKSMQAINITEPTSANFLLGLKQKTVVPKVNAINIVIGYTYSFIKTDKLVNMKVL